MISLPVEPPRALVWRDVENLGRVYLHPKRGWCVEYRSVHWPGRAKPRRVLITEHEDFGRLESEAEAIKVQMRVQARVLDQRPLHEVLSRYIHEVPEDSVLYRYREEFLPQRRTRHAEGRLSTKRLNEFLQYEGRGHLEFWASIALHRVNAALLERWVHWLYQRGLRGGGIRHLVADFGTFLRYEHRIGSLRQVPELPHVEWVPEERAVPELVDARRIVEHIPEAQRGVWLARTLAGLRPAEGRRLDVRHYDFGRGELTIPTLSRNKRGRLLPIRDVVPELHAWLEQHRQGAMGAEPLFPRVKGRRWLKHAELLCWARACAAAGVEYVAPNDAGRHAFATEEACGGTNLHALREWLGHTSLTTTQRYVHLRSTRLARMMRPSPSPQKKITSAP